MYSSVNLFTVILPTDLFFKINRYYSIPGDGQIPINLGFYLLEGFWYLVGALFYALRIPERFYPKTFDFIVTL